jgi:hypothetical protein
MKRYCLCLVIALSGCGTPPGVNSDVPNVAYAGISRPVPAAQDDIEIIATNSDIANPVSGVSCKNKLWDPAPSEENATLLMKNEAKNKGFNAIHSVTVKPLAGAVVINCWQAIEAKGFAFNKEQIKPILNE